MKKQYWIIAFSLISSVITAQNVMSLQDCLQLGLENNYEIRMSRNEEQISDNNATKGNAGYLPGANLNGGYTLRNSGSSQFPMGGSDAAVTRNANTGTLDAAVNLNWTLFEGYKVQTNYKRLKELQNIGKLNTRLSVENIISSISSEYFNFVQQQIHLRNLKNAVDLSRERVRIVEARYQVGAGSRLDLQQAKVDFNTDSSLLIQQKETLYASRIRLNELMGVDVNREFVAGDTDIHIGAMLPKEALQEQIKQQNALLMLSEKNKNISELDLKILQSRNYPYLRLNTGYGLTHSDYNKGAMDRQLNWGPNIGLTVGYTIFDGFNRSREQKNARIAIQNRGLAVEKKELELQSDFNTIWMAYQNNLELTKLEQISLENAKLNYEIAIERYKIGDLSGFQLREAQNGLLNAEQRLLTAKYRTKLYEISLKQISGTVDSYLR